MAHQQHTARVHDLQILRLCRESQQDVVTGKVDDACSKLWLAMQLYRQRRKERRQ